MSGAIPYDPEARRDTPLALKLKERISQSGPMTVAQYMDACLNDPEHGYYRTQTAIGATGDFVTAPEISQVFGELIGLWSAVVWQQMGSPARFNLVELGPGRGTMMADALRAVRRVPGFLDAVGVSLIEVSAPLIADQRRTLEAWAEKIAWRTSLADLPPAPTIVIGNEFLDTFPVEQFERSDAGVVPRRIGLLDGRLVFVRLPDDDATPDKAAPADGAVVEAHDWSGLEALRASERPTPWTALFIDYGYFDATRHHDHLVTGDTLQAVRGHAPEHPLTSPGEADLTCHVNFNGLKGYIEAELSSEAAPLIVDGPITQGEFLGRLGIVERASRLMSANPDKAHAIEAGVARLMAVPGMGNRFKAIGIRSADLPPLPGF